MKINSIRIRNFRSLRQLDLEFERLNIFVGKNDSGKSNLLRALDLFFNFNKGYVFEWNEDFCAFAQTAQRKADEIEITLELSPASNFSEQRPVRWKRVWRKEGLKFDEMRHADGSKLSSKNKFLSQLWSVRYDYVPAIKGDEYFGQLLGDMHDMLELTVEKEIREASSGFMDAINAHTGSIISDLLEKLGLKSSIQLPPDLRELFSQLDFRSSCNVKEFSLAQRGDGIKIRHIPIILRWLANQAQTLKDRGRPRIVTVWGYEEPENNLELGRCQELASDFLSGSVEIQSFISTHSPAFYSVFREDEQGSVALFGVKKIEDESESEILRLTEDDLSDLDGSMGLMPLIEPYYAEAIAEVEKIKKNRADLPSTDKPVLFVEGLTDKRILEVAIEFLFPKASQKIEIYSRTSAGTGWVADRLIAWAHTDPKTVGVALFDNDKSGNDAKSRCNDSPKVLKSEFAKALILGKCDHLVACIRLGFEVPHAIEELFPPFVWIHAEEEDWLERRTGLISAYKFQRTDITFDDHLSSSIEDIDLIRYVSKKVKNEEKSSFAKYVSELTGEQRNEALECLRRPVKEILEKIGFTSPEKGSLSQPKK